MMAADLKLDDSAGSPAFFLQLGDVIYFNNTDPGYLDQFYQPYKPYPGKIIAIAGNHDGEVKGGNQASTLLAFKKNFCPPQPTVKVSQVKGIPRNPQVSEFETVSINLADHTVRTS